MHLDGWFSCLDTGLEKTNMLGPSFQKLWGVGKFSERGKAGLLAF